MTENILLYASILSALIPISIGIRNRNSLLWTYVTLAFLADIIQLLLKRVFLVPHHPVANIFILTEFLLISAIYKNEIFKKNDKLFYGFVVFLSSVFVIGVFTQDETIFKLNTTGAGLFYFSYIIYAIAGFFTILKKQQVLFIERSSFFWVNVALLLYASGSVLTLLFHNYLDERFFLFLWHICFRVLNISKNVILAVALSRKTSKLEF